MKLKNLAIGLALPVSMLAVCASAAAGGDGYGDGYITEATVISAKPVYRTVRVNDPRRRCWDEPVRTRSTASAGRSHTSTILGAIVGAAVGNEFGGSDRGRNAATVAGAILGGSIGRDFKNSRNHYSDHGRVHYEQRCETVDNFHTEERLDGYDVTYRYDGNVYRTHTRHHPGDTIRVSVNVSPVE